MIIDKMKENAEARSAQGKRPEVCLSLNCKTIDDLIEEIIKYKDYCQLVEWCVDMTEGSWEYTKEEFQDRLRTIKALCKGKKLVVDYKEKEDRGNQIQRWAMGIADIIDLDADNSQLHTMVKEARRKRTKTLISHHVFEGMPSREEIAQQYIKMEKSGGDILKIACSAKEEKDTYIILEAAASYCQLSNHKPIVAIAMGKEGQTSRVCAGDFGSVISYSCGSEPTAPGQFDAKTLSQYLDQYYEGR